jgi:hypothetical protein
VPKQVAVSEKKGLNDGGEFGTKVRLIHEFRFESFTIDLFEVRRKLFTIRHVNLSVFFDSCLSFDHDHWSPATVCHQPTVMRSTQDGGVRIGFLGGRHDRD